MNSYDERYRDKDLTFRVAGGLFEDGYDLYQTVDCLQNLQNIFDKAYLTITEKSKVTEKDRALYKVKAREIRKGSFIAELTVYICGAVQVVIPILAHYSPTFLWDVTKEAFNYLKFVLEANKEGKSVTMTNTGDGTIQISISGSNEGSIVIAEKAYFLASKTFDSFQNMARKVDGQEVDIIEILDRDDPKKSVIFTKHESEIFTLESSLEDIPIKVIGRIFRIDTHTNSGKMYVVSCEDNTLQGNEINFELQFSNDMSKCCKVIDEDVEFVVYRRIVFNPIKLKDEVKLFKIISINV